MLAQCRQNPEPHTPPPPPPDNRWKGVGSDRYAQMSGKEYLGGDELLRNKYNGKLEWVGNKAVKRTATGAIETIGDEEAELDPHTGKVLKLGGRDVTNLDID